MSNFPGLTHVAITVSDLPASTAWYTALFGSAPVLDEDEESGTFHHTVFALDGGMLFGLHTHPDGVAPTRFDERQVGLDHIAFQCSPRRTAPVGGAARCPRHRARGHQDSALRFGHLVP